MSALNRSAFISCALSLFASCLSFGQISTGTISGSVEDPSGALIPSAQIAVKQLSTGETREPARTQAESSTFPFSNRVNTRSLQRPGDSSPKH